MGTKNWRDILHFPAGLRHVCPKSKEAPAPEPLKDPVAFAEQQLDFHPDEIQQQILRTTAKQCALLMGRQTGKSTVTALKAVHLALTQPGATIIIAGRVGRQSSELIRTAKSFLAKAGAAFKSSGESIFLKNGSRFIAIPGSAEDNIRGFSAIHLLIIDEAAFASDKLYQTLRPMCAVTDGATILLSTPNGPQGFFYEAWHRQKTEWERFFQPASQCARIPKSFLEREQKALPGAVFRSEYECEFTDPIGSLFTREQIESLFDKDVYAKNL